MEYTLIHNLGDNGLNFETKGLQCFFIFCFNLMSLGKKKKKKKENASLR